MKISLIIPAWNEEAFLPRLLESVEIAQARFAETGGEVEVIVADNGSTDRTREIAAARGCKVVQVSKRCIAAARNGGAAAASGEILAFVDADFRISPQTFIYISEVLKHPEVIGGGTGLTMERWSPGIRAVWLLLMPSLLLLGFDGGVWFARQADFELVGGYDETVQATEDVRFLRSLQKLGKTRTPRQKTVTRFAAKKYGLTPATAICSARKFDQHGDWHMFRDLLLRAPKMLFSRKVFDEYIDAYWYQGRKAPDASDENR